MTTRDERTVTARLLDPDHLPTCPRCWDLCERDASYCPECGTRLVPKSASRDEGGSNG